jgi:hypothetical protein
MRSLLREQVNLKKMVTHAKKGTEGSSVTFNWLLSHAGCDALKFGTALVSSLFEGMSVCVCVADLARPPRSPCVKTARARAPRWAKPHKSASSKARGRAFADARRGARGPPSARKHARSRTYAHTTPG